MQNKFMSTTWKTDVVLRTNCQSACSHVNNAKINYIQFMRVCTLWYDHLHMTSNLTRCPGDLPDMWTHFFFCVPQVGARTSWKTKFHRTQLQLQLPLLWQSLQWPLVENRHQDFHRGHKHRNMCDLVRKWKCRFFDKLLSYPEYLNWGNTRLKLISAHKWGIFRLSKLH